MNICSKFLNVLENQTNAVAVTQFKENAVEQFNFFTGPSNLNQYKKVRNFFDLDSPIQLKKITEIYSVVSSSLRALIANNKRNILCTPPPPQSLINESKNPFKEVEVVTAVTEVSAV